MIRINLLGQTRPRAARRRGPMMDTGAVTPLVFVGAGAALGVLALFLLYLSWQKQLNEENTRIKQLQVQKADLEQVKQQVDTFEAQKKILTQRVATIEQLQRDRTGAQELLDEIASTVSRTENLWLITVANFITALKRSGYFQKVEIKETKQDDKSTGIQTFVFQMTAEISPPQLGPVRPQQPKAVGTPAAPATPAKKG